MPTPSELREEADAAERLSVVLSYARDKQWLLEKAEALRQQADRQEQTTHRPRER
jgi:hypothetical protein